MRRVPARTWRVLPELLVLPDSRGLLLVMASVAMVIVGADRAAYGLRRDGDPSQLFGPEVEVFLFLWPLLLWAGQDRRTAYQQTLPMARWRNELLRVAATLVVAGVPLAVGYAYRTVMLTQELGMPQGLLPGGYPVWYPAAAVTSRVLLLMMGMAVAMRTRRPGVAVALLSIGLLLAVRADLSFAGARVDEAFVGLGSTPAAVHAVGMRGWLEATGLWVAGLAALLGLLAAWPRTDDAPWAGALARVLPRARGKGAFGRPAARGRVLRLLGVAAAEFRALAPLMVAPALAAVLIGLVVAVAGRREGVLAASAWRAALDGPAFFWAALPFPVVLWRGADAVQRAYRRSMPVGSVALDAVRVAAGAVWLLLLVHLALGIVFVGLALRHGADALSPLPRFVWPGLPGAVMIIYLVGTPAAREGRLPLLIAFIVGMVLFMSAMVTGIGERERSTWSFFGAITPAVMSAEPRDGQWMAALFLWVPLMAGLVLAHLAYVGRREADEGWSLRAVLLRGLRARWRLWAPRVI